MTLMVISANLKAMMTMTTIFDQASARSFKLQNQLQMM
jgi:hypothetical protein